MHYADALAYLDDHASYEKTGRITSPSPRADHAGSPRRWATRSTRCPVIHVTGTNGKGSTVQMITRLLMAHGPDGRHLHQPAPRTDQRADLERNGEPIDDDDFAEQIAGDRRPRGVIGVRPTYFET